MSVKAIPEGYHSVTAYLVMRNAGQAIDYYTKAFGANELFRMPMPDGKIGHAEMMIGDSHIMLADEVPERGIQGPQALGGTPVSLMIYVEDVDAVYARAIAAGGTEKHSLKDQFYGDRSGTLTDPFGHVWTVATHTEDVSPEEMSRRMASMGGEQS